MYKSFGQTVSEEEAKQCYKYIEDCPIVKTAHVTRTNSGRNIVCRFTVDLCEFPIGEYGIPQAIPIGELGMRYCFCGYEAGDTRVLLSFYLSWADGSSDGLEFNGPITNYMIYDTEETD